MSKARDIASASPAPSTVSATELGYLDGVSSAIQTQLDGKASTTADIPKSLIDAKGDLIVGSAADTAARLAVGTNDYVLTADSSATNGVKWAALPAAGGGGKVLQVVQGTTTTSTYIATTSFTDTSLSATITPSANTSKILVIISQYCRIEDNTALAKVGYQLLRNSTAIYTIDGGGNQAGLLTPAQDVPSIEMRTVLNGTYLDSPATTSAITYKTQGNTADNVYFQHNSTISTLTLLEIGA